MAGKPVHVWVENSRICFLQSFCAEGKSMNLASTSGSVSQVVSGRSIWFLRGLCATGLGISGYLAWTAFQMGEVFGCGSGGSVFDCSHVLSSKWSKVFGVPVSVPAFGLYASLLTLLAFIRRDAPAPFRRLLWSGMTLGALMAGLAALWFIGLQVFVLKHLCWYCLTVHSCGLILSFLMLRGKSLSLTDKSRLAMIAALGVAGLMSIQIMSREEDHFEVVNFDELPAETEAVASAEELAPGEVFSAPGEDVFEAPVPDVFEAPGSESVSAPVESGVAPSKDSAPVNADSVQPVATTVLTILLPRFSFLTQMPMISQDATATNSQESQAAESQEAKPADAKPADESKPAAVAPPAAPEPRKVTVASNRMTLNAMQWPILGKPDAEVIFVEMFDYTCPHCRSTHSAVKGALQKYGNKVAILALPVPLEAKCNPAAGGGGHAGACDLAKIAITVWRVNPAKFQEFHDWLFENQVTPATARGKAEQLVGADVFRKEYDSKIPSEYVKRHVELYKKVGSGSVPKLIFEKTMLNGSVGSRESLCAAIEREYPHL
jgi:uncharacterized membrane protein/protein-disulfide isomerase